MPDDQRICTLKPSDRIDIGDTVAYAQAFLSRHRQYPNGMSSALGIVKALHCLQNGTILADILWNKPDLPKRVDVKNLMQAQSAASRRTT